MSESKSKTEGTARGTSSLDALSRTIDGLEARLENLVARKGAASTDTPAREDGAGAPHESPTAEILERQRILERERARLEARLSARRPAAATAATETSLREIAESLVGLRADLGKDFSDSLGRELTAIREEIAAMSAGQAQPLPAAMRAEMLRLAECIERLGARTSASEDEGLAGEVRSLRTLLEEIAAENRRGLTSFEARLDEMETPTLRSEVVGLVQRLDEMKQAVSALAGTSDGNEIEEQLKNVAAALETLAEQVNLDEASIDHRFSEMAQRLDEISRAIVSVGSRSDRSQDAETLARIESRLTGLAGRIEDLGEEGGAIDGLAERLTAIARRMDALASEDAVAGLAERLDQLSLMLERGAAQDDETDLARRLVEISDKIDALGQGALDEPLGARFDDLAERIDTLAAGLDAASGRLADQAEALAARAAAPAEAAMPAGLEQRLVDIVERLDDLRPGAPDSDAAQGMEARLAHLTGLMNQLAGGEGDPALAPRVTAIEEHLETTDDYIIEAARQAAEAVVEAYGRNGGGQSQSANGDIAVISELAEDLRSLEKLSQKSEERTARAFDAVHDTLVKIAEHLEAIGPGRAGQGPSGRPVGGDDERQRHDWPGDDLPETTEAVPQAGAASADAKEATARERAAAAARTSIMEDDDFEGFEVHADERPGRPKGLLARVGERMRPSRPDTRPDVDADGDEPERPERTSLDLAPSIDPSDALEDPQGGRDEGDGGDEPAVPLNEPLEPGSGPPDIDRILQKVREVQNQEVQRDEKSDFIAAARRAAQAAAAEVETVGGPGTLKSRGGLAAMIKARRRPILLAVGAVLLVVMSWPLASALMKRPENPATVGAAAGTTAKSAKTVASATKPDISGGKASAVKPGVSDEKTGATSEGAPLPKVRAVDEGGAAAGAKTGAAADASSTPSASSAPSTPADASPVVVGDGPQEPQVQMKAAAEAKPGQAPETAGPAAAPAGSEKVAGEGPTPAVKAPAPAAPKVGQATAQAIPKIPATISSQSLKTAAEKGDPKALYEIATLYTQGRGVKADLGAAADWYRAAAERGLAPAQYRLGNLYEKGVGVDRDVKKARDWYLKAADAGNVSAMHNLAVLYAMGKVGTPDYAAAARWFRNAADHGVKDSQFNLAILYAQGRGVPRDLAKSYKWFAVAASAGDSDATRKRDEVAAALDSSELKKARAAASDWTPKPVDPVANEVAIPPEWKGDNTRTASVDMSKAIRNIQAILDNNGFDAGKPDGIMGDKTRSAIRAFQKSIGEAPTGRINDALIKKLLELNRQHKPSQNS